MTDNRNSDITPHYFPHADKKLGNRRGRCERRFSRFRFIHSLPPKEMDETVPRRAAASGDGMDQRKPCSLPGD